MKQKDRKKKKKYKVWSASKSMRDIDIPKGLQLTYLLCEKIEVHFHVFSLNEMLSAGH